MNKYQRLVIYLLILVIIIFIMAKPRIFWANSETEQFYNQLFYIYLPSISVIFAGILIYILRDKKRSD
jgi:hypothetical protein